MSDQFERRVWKRVGAGQWSVDDLGTVKRIEFGPSAGQWSWSLWVVCDNIREVQQFGREETRDEAMAALKQSYDKMVNPQMPPPPREKKPIAW